MAYDAALPTLVPATAAAVTQSVQLQWRHYYFTQLDRLDGELYVALVLIFRFLIRLGNHRLLAPLQQTIENVVRFTHAVANELFIVPLGATSAFFFVGA